MGGKRNGNKEEKKERQGKWMMDRKQGEKVGGKKVNTVLILGFHGGYLLVLILFLGCYTVWFCALLPTFQMCMLPSSSGSKCVRWSLALCICCVDIAFCFFRKELWKGVEWGLVPRPGQSSHPLDPDEAPNPTLFSSPCFFSKTE
jgi:hypothetical protein